MAKKWWWPFGDEGESEAGVAQNQFMEMLQEATLVKDDLRKATEDMKAERLRRIGISQARKPSTPPPRAKLQSQPTGTTS